MLGKKTSPGKFTLSSVRNVLMSHTVFIISSFVTEVNIHVISQTTTTLCMLGNRPYAVSVAPDQLAYPQSL